MLGGYSIFQLQVASQPVLRQNTDAKPEVSVASLQAIAVDSIAEQFAHFLQSKGGMEGQYSFNSIYLTLFSDEGLPYLMIANAFYEQREDYVALVNGLLPPDQKLICVFDPLISRA